MVTRLLTGCMYYGTNYIIYLLQELLQRRQQQQQHQQHQRLKTCRRVSDASAALLMTTACIVTHRVSKLATTVP